MQNSQYQQNPYSAQPNIHGQYGAAPGQFGQPAPGQFPQTPQTQAQYGQGGQVQGGYGQGQGGYGQGQGGQRQGQGQQHRPQNDDDCCNDCNCDDCGECCGDCKGCCDCECTECGCDCLKTINTTCCQGCTCCACMACCSSGDILTELNFKHQVFADEEESAQLLIEFRKVISMYHVNKKSKDAHLGDCLTLGLKKTVTGTDLPKKMYLKNIWLNTSQEYHKQIRFWHSVTLHITTPGVLRVHAVYGQQIADLCVDRWRISLLIDHGHPLDEKTKEFRKELPIAQILLQLSIGLKFLHTQIGEYFREQAFFHKSRVFIVGHDQYKLLPPYLDLEGNSKYDQSKSKHVNDNDENLVLALMKSKKLEGVLPAEMGKAEGDQDLEKCDVWMLATMSMSLMLKQPLPLDAEGKLDEAKFQAMRESLKVKLPYPVFVCFDKMMASNPEDRYDCNQVRAKLGHLEGVEVRSQNVSTSQPQIQMIVPQLPQLSTTRQYPHADNQVQVDRYQELNGGLYTGTRFKGKKHGYGRLEMKDGSGYEGNWQNDKMHGEGTLYYPQGRKAYEGNFAEDRFQGFGHLFSAQVKQFGGPWNYKDLAHIDGYWTKYEGDFKADKKHGYGILYLINGEKWAGEFKEDVPDGFGTFYRMYLDIQQDELLNQQIKNVESKVTGTWRRGELIITN